MLNNAVVSVWLAFLVHFSPKNKIGTVILRILQYLASQLVMVSTRRGRDYQEDAAIAAAIAAVEAANDAAAEAIEEAVVDFAASIGIDDEGAAEIDVFYDADDGDEVRGDDAVAGGDDADSANGEINAGDDQGNGGGGVDGGGVAWEMITKKCKSEMRGDEIFMYFDDQLKGIESCPNRRCNCVNILVNWPIRATFVRYLCWFNTKTNYKQNSIVFEWFKYAALRKADGKMKGDGKMYWFCLPFIGDGATDDVLHAVRKHVVCSRGLLLILDFGTRRWRAIRNASTVSGVFPQHKGIGKIHYNSIQLDETRLVPLTRHFEL